MSPMPTRDRCWLLVVMAASLTGSLSGCATRDARADNEVVARRVFDEILSQGRYGAAKDLYDPAFVNHGRHRDIGLAEDQAAAKGWRDAFPDLSMHVEKVVAQGDLVAVLWSARGTNTGEGNGLPATGRTAEGRGLTLWRIRHGHITDEWSEFDQTEIARQLGLIGAR